MTTNETIARREIPGYEGRYDVGEDGSVRNVRTGRFLAECQAARHYPSYGLHKDGKGRRFKTHRLVTAAFLGPCPAGLEVNHKDGDKENNHISNLEYVTRSENSFHALRAGLSSLPPCARGEDHKRSKLTVSDVRTIRSLLAQKVPQRRIASQFGVSQKCISYINREQTWGWLD